MAATFALAGAVCLSNALWFYNWRVRAVQHHEALEAAKKARPPRQVVYVMHPDAAAIPTAPARRPMANNEQCRGGILFRRDGDTLESTGEPCTH